MLPSAWWSCRGRSQSTGVTLCSWCVCVAAFAIDGTMSYTWKSSSVAFLSMGSALANKPEITPTLAASLDLRSPKSSCAERRNVMLSLLNGCLELHGRSRLQALCTQTRAVGEHEPSSPHSKCPNEKPGDGRRGNRRETRLRSARALGISRTRQVSTYSANSSLRDATSAVHPLDLQVCKYSKSRRHLRIFLKRLSMWQQPNRFS